MNKLKEVYQLSLSLLTDLYQLTMAYGYWKSGISERESVFHLFFRNNPFNGGYTVSCGLEYVINFLEDFKFNEEDTAYLATINAPNGTPLFEKEFLDYLLELKFTCQVDAIPEGTVVFPHEPLIRIQGPVLQCQLLETPLLNIINFQSLIATKASRIYLAAKGDPILEFGLRRAQGIDGALAASRAAYIGGCSSTSNVLAGKLFGIPVNGTHAHSWVMSFENEFEAFKTYAEALPDNCILLVDTYDTLEGVKNAIKVADILKKKDKKIIGIRIDSGDLAYLSIKARELLDQAGFEDAKIFASNDLDEYLLQSLKEQDAEINAWGIGTKLVTAYDQPALGAVYKLSALKNKDELWESKIKLSEQSFKINNPGKQQVRRFFQNKKFFTDMIFNELDDHITDPFIIIDPLDPTRQKILSSNEYFYQDLLIPIFRNGNLVYEIPALTHVKENLKHELGFLFKGNKRFINPHTYPVGLHEKLYKEKMRLILKLRKGIKKINFNTKE
ncbi:nicotinate phosphoribosyltransferase [soil metagenome]